MVGVTMSIAPKVERERLAIVWVEIFILWNGLYITTIAVYAHGCLYSIGHLE